MRRSIRHIALAFTVFLLAVLPMRSADVVAPTQLAALLTEYAKAKAELAKVEAVMTSRTGIGKKLADLLGAIPGVGNIKEAVEKFASMSEEELLAKYSTLRSEVQSLQSQIQQKLYDMQRVSDAARQIANGGDIRNIISSSLYALSPYIEKSEELLDYLNYYRDYETLFTTGYEYFFNRINNSHDWWNSPSDLASDIQMYSYVSGKIEDDWMFLHTYVLDPTKGSLSNKERRDEIREAHRNFQSYLSQLQQMIADRERESIEARENMAAMIAADAAFVPKVNVDNAIASPQELDDMIERMITEDALDIEDNEEGLGGFGSPLLDIISALTGLIAIIFTVVNTGKVQKGEQQKQDALFKVWLGVFIMILVLQIIKKLFFV